MKATLGPGDIVRLKSGSPDMVVRAVKDDAVWVNWIVCGYPQSTYYGDEQLEKVNKKRTRQK